MLQTRVRQFIQKHELLQQGDRILVAYSGGPDSTCLLVLLREIWKDTAAVYINHSLRGEESKQEEEFVRNFCVSRGIPLFVERILWKKKPANLEEAARKRRYRCLDKVAAQHGYSKIALAHHRDDAVETFLLRLLRGSGPLGLVGLYPQRGAYIRPLLDCSRQEIRKYLSWKGIPYFEDTSNLQLNARRNRIRNELIPYLQEHFNPAISRGMYRNLQWLKEQNQLLAELLNPYEKLIRCKNGRWLLQRKRLLMLSSPLQKALLRLAAQKADPTLRLSSGSMERLRQAVEKQRNLELPGFLMVKSTPTSVQFTLKTRRVGHFEVDIPKEGTYFFPPANASLRFSIQKSRKIHPTRNAAFLDGERACFPLHVRNWKKGDSFRPLGMKGHKKLSDFWIDRKVPREQRKTIPLVFREDDLLWAAGHEIHHEYRITDSTSLVLRIELVRRHV